jgi:hypothetical protein
MAVSRSIKCKKVSLSSAEAELHALVEAAKEVIWFRAFLEELGYKQEGATPVYEDNSAVIDWMGSFKAQARTKHLNKLLQAVHQKWRHANGMGRER